MTSAGAALIDSHCHLADPVFSDDLDDVIARARGAGVAAALCILAVDDADELARAPVVRSTWDAVRFAAGIHPHRAGHFTGRYDEAAAAVRAALTESAAVAVGEIGLDYHYDFAPRPVQQDIFALQIDVAAAVGLPVVIHTREAADDTLAVIRGATSPVSGVLHCFTGSLAEARQALDLGLHISMSGILTFPRSASLREVAAFVPADRLLIETDAPYLAPVPHRGKRNEPAWVVETCRILADVRGTDAATLAGQLSTNTTRLLQGMGNDRAR